MVGEGADIRTTTPRRHRLDILASPDEKGRSMSQQPAGGGPGHHRAVEILRKIVDVTDRMQKARQSGSQQDLQAAQEARREAMQEAREFLRTHQG
jgi:hypothetical protein